jgi:hypothetical protein
MNLGTLTAILAVVDKISPAVSGISGNVGKAMGAIKGAIAGAFAVDVITKAIGKFTEFTGRVTDTAAKLGISTTAVQKFELAFADAGVGIDTVGNAIGEMGKRLVEGDSGAVNALERLGLKTGDLLKMAPDAAFTKIADAVAGIQNPMERATVAQEVFGKGGKEMLAALDGKLAETTQGFEDMGMVMSEDLVAAGDNLGDALGHLSTAGMNLLGTVLAPMLPLLTQLVEWLGQAAQVASVVAQWFGQELLGAFNSAKEALFSFLSDLADTASKVPIVGSAMKGIGDAAGWLKQKAVEAGNALQQTYQGMRQEIKGQAQPAVESIARVVGVYGENAKAAAEKTKAADEATKAWRESIKTFGVTTGGYLNVVVEGLQDSKTEIAEVRQSMEAMASIRFNDTWATFQQGVTEARSNVGMLGQDIRDGLVAVIAAAPASLARAFESGGDIGGAVKAMVSQAGAALGASIGRYYAGALGAALGGAIGSFAGAAGGAFMRWFTNAGSKEATEMLRQFTRQAGESLTVIAQRAKEAGLSMQAIYNAKDAKSMQRALEDLVDGLDQHQRMMQLGKAAMEEFGISAEKAGQSFKQAQMDEEAAAFTEKIEAMLQIGVSMEDIIAGAGDELGAFIQRAIETGTTVPKEWEPIVRKMIEAGTLIDKNGDKFTDMSQVPFAETLNDKIGAVMDKLAKLLERILQVPDALGRIPREVDVDINYRERREGGGGGGGRRRDDDGDGFANGSAGIRDFGTGTWAILHGRERVQTEAQMRQEQAFGGGGAGVTVHVDARGALVGDYASQQQLANVVSEAVIRRLGLRGRLNIAGAY